MGENKKKMKLALPKTELQRGLSRMQAIVERRNSMPILANALLVATKDPSSLEIAATDLEVGIRGTHDAEVKSSGSLTVSARKLYEIVRELPDDSVELSATSNGYLEIRCARSRFTLAGTTAEEFPSLPELSPGRMARLQAVVLSTMVEHTVYAVSTDETRYNLNGVFFEVVEGSQKVRMVATDGHRLGLIERSVGAEVENLASGVILPRKALAELKRLVDEEDAHEVELGFQGNSALARKGGVTLVMRLIEGEFPNYQQVVPKASTHRFALSSEVLGQAVRRVALLSSEHSRAVRFGLTAGRLSISSSNPELGEAEEELDVDYAGDGLTIGFNARYLLDALGAFRCKEVELGLQDELSPAVIRPADDEESLAVVMPMRI